MDLTTRIIEIARTYIGKKEKPNNSGFIDPLFEKKMKSRGWINGQAWCAYTAELIWYDAFTEMDACAVPLINKYFSGSAVATYRNFKASPEFAVRDTPKPGSVAIWQHGKSALGHAAIVVEINGDSFKSVEGNTNASGGREGIEVALKIRKMNQPFQEKGLNLLGFVHPIRIK